MTKVLFVCLGNICRSPMAEGLLKKMVAEDGQSDRFLIDSAATSTYEVGRSPHKGTKKILENENVDTSQMIARQITEEDFQRFDWIIGMDQSNVEDLQRMAPTDAQHKIHLFLSRVPGKKHKMFLIHTIPNFDETYQLLTEGLKYWMQEWKKINKITIYLYR